MHISLDSALGQQRRLNQVGETISSIAAPTAAYSLRSITGGDPKVVRVRRESDNHEQDFTASEVSSGALVDFVNTQVTAPLDIQALTATGRDGDFLIAKAAYSLRSLGTRQATVAATGDTVARADGKYVCQVRRNVNADLKSFTADEVTDGTLVSFVNESFTSSLPLDVQGSAAAAYSLRNLSSSYSGNVVEVRRSSDDTTQNFTADEVTNGTLLSFTNEDVVVYSSDYSSGTDSWSFSGGSLAAPQSIGGEDNALKVTLSGDGFFFPQKSGVLVSGETYSISVKLYVPSDNTNSNLNFNVRENGGGTIVDCNLTEANAWQTFTASLTAGAGLVLQVTSDVSMTSGDVIYIKDVVVTQTSNSSGFVKTWYDQSGSTNHATQTDTAKQPKIVDAGSLVERNSKPSLKFSSSNLSKLDFAKAQPNTAFCVGETVETGTDFQPFIDGSEASVSTSGRNQIGVRLSSNQWQMFAGTAYRPFSYAAGLHLAGGLFNGTSSRMYLDGSESAEGDVGTQQFGDLRIGSQGGTVTLNGFMSEVIIYDTDQSDKRRAIEESIATNYGITLASFNRDGFVKTWYDQSVTTQAGDTATGNHATQSTAASQPKIVDAGSLLTDGINFDGSNDLLSGTTISSLASGAVFYVFKSEATNEGQLFQFSNGSTYSTSATINSGSEGRLVASSDASTDSRNGPVFGATGVTTNQKHLLSLVLDSSTEITTATVDGSSMSSGASPTGRHNNNISTLSIGQRGDNSFSIQNLVSEVIIYNTDQTDNRTAIEANIGEHYSISGIPAFDNSVNGFVETWYDQSGNGRDAVQATAANQPKIVNAGSLLNELEFDGSDDELDFTALNASDVSIFSVASFDDAAGQDRIISGQSTQTGEGFGKASATKGFFRANGQSARQPNLNVTISADQDILLSFIRASNTGTFFTNGTTSDTFTESAAFKAGSIGGAGSKIDGSLKELIIYTSDQSSSRTAIETNINGHYSIF